MKKDKFALRPPMGWNSYDYYDTTVTEEEVLANAKVMAEKLQQFGWEYVVVDIEWYSRDAGTKRPEVQYIPFGDDELDAFGRFQPAVNRFPSSADGTGFRHLSDKIHEMGLKFGIHIMRGISRKAAWDHLPLHGQEGVTAADVADPISICEWNPDMYGVRDTPEGQAYYDDLIRMYADWGVDFIKCDDICDSKLYHDGYEEERFSGWHEIRMLQHAIEKCGRSIVLSLSPGPAHIDKAWLYEQNANMWRITDDFWDEWTLLKNMFARCELWQEHVRPGCWPDCDMLPLGIIGGGFRAERRTNFTPAEQRTMMTLWTFFGSPLMLGAELTKLDDKTLRLLQDEQLMKLMDGHHQGRQLKRTESEAVWMNTDEATGEQLLALFNLRDEDGSVSCRLADGREIAIDVPAHDVRVIQL